MKGGGLTWAGWLAVGVGAMLIYSGMTGQSLIAELAAVFNGDKLPAATPKPSPYGNAGSSAAAEHAPKGNNAGSSAAAEREWAGQRAIPLPTHTAAP